MRIVLVTIALAFSTASCGLLIGLQEWSNPDFGTAGSGGSRGSGGGSATSGPGGSEGGPTCADGIKNGLETDVDCGGDACGPCSTGHVCLNDADCALGNCDALGCQEGGKCCQSVPKDGGTSHPPDATCADGVQNGLETDVDCGGDACLPCGLGLSCKDDADCASGFCVPCARGLCCAATPPDGGLPPTCTDGLKNDTETGVDCGGPTCPPCAIDQTCIVNSDCESHHCVTGNCN